MKVVTGETMQNLDRQAIEEHGISGLTLMESAGYGCVAVINDRFAAFALKRAVIVAGKGNNGGDGFVIARGLLESGWQVKTLVFAARESIAGDALTNLERLDPDGVLFLNDIEHLHYVKLMLAERAVVVDALFGTGLKSEVRGIYAEVIDLINSSENPVVAVDIPSGIDAGTGRILGRAVRADETVTFALAKVGHILYPGAEYAGNLHVVDIGIPPQVCDESPGYEFIDTKAIKPLIKRRSKSAHKGSFGHCLIVAGSWGKTGAAAMAANSAVRTGAGLVTLAVPERVNAILEVKTTEAMTLPLPDGGRGFLAEDAEAALIEALAGKDALAIGPGLSRDTQTARLVRRLVETTELPIVVDADGLNALSEDPSVLLRKRSSSVILTPHPGEMSRLCGMEIAAIEADRLKAAAVFAKRYGIYLVLKGARTVLAAPDGRIAINGSGNPGMASGGMGDVLTGVLVALLAQGYEPFNACTCGVFLHGFAADLIAAEQGEAGMTATDVQERLPRAIRQLVA